MGNPFNNTILGSLYDAKAASDAAQGLMMGAVSNHMLSIQCFQKRIGGNRGSMSFVAVIPCVPWGFFNMLYNGAAEKNIDDLHSLADAKDGAFLFDKNIQSL